MSATHTTGPWNKGQGPHNRQREIFGPSGWLIADCRTNQRSIKEEEANARLIAASPELLEACKMVEGAISWAKEHHGNKWQDHLTCQWSFLLNAIAKAEGGAA